MGNGRASFHLAQQLDRARVAASGECGHPTGGISRHGAQKLGQFACCAGIEAAIGAMSQASDLAKYTFNFSIVTLLEHESRDTGPSQSGSVLSEIIRIFLHGIADEDQRLHLEEFGLAFSGRLWQRVKRRDRSLGPASAVRPGRGPEVQAEALAKLVTCGSTGSKERPASWRSRQ